jgi:hypothetical protein
VASTSTDERGRFIFPFVPVGQYVVAAMRFRESAQPPGSAPAIPPVEHSIAHPGMPGASVMQLIGVGEEGAANVLLTMKPGVTIRARADFEGAPMPDERQLRNFALIARLARPVLRYQGQQATVAYADTSSLFRLAGLVPGRYAIQVPAPPTGWWLQSVAIGGLEVGDGGFDFDSDRSDIVLKFVDKPLGLSGTVHDANGEADAAAVVAIFPADPSRWVDARLSALSFQLARPSKSGQFAVRQLFPGEYVVAAVRGADLEAWPEASVLRRLSAVGTNVRVSSGTGSSVTLTTKALR